MRLTRALHVLLPLISLPPQTLAQTNVGCDASCPPLGYESDSSHVCPGNTVDPAVASRRHEVCHPADSDLAPDGGLSLDSFKRRGRVTVLANYYTGCEAGRRESGVFAGIAQRIHDETGGLVTFMTTLKGGGDCAQWAGLYQRDALGMGLNGGVKPSTMPLTISDGNFDLRDSFFTPPYPHPSYIILDENLEVTYKSVGPCCGYISYYACTDDVALELDGMLTEKIYEVYNKQLSSEDATITEAEPDVHDKQPTSTAAVANVFDDGASTCQAATYSEWSGCSKTCGEGGIRFRYRLNSDQPVETQPCPVNVASTLPPCSEQCVPEFGADFDITIVASDLASPRDLAFHPTPGVHLGSYSEGRLFHPYEGEELWIANGNNHSVSIVASLGTEHQTTISRRDRGYYHYMNNVTALAFNGVRDSGRNVDQDTLNYFAVCNDNINDYVGSKEPNYFMGPTLYDTDTVNKLGRKNTVTRAGEDCAGNTADECFLLHADMLHESPACIGITHDPELETAYGAVYWAFDTTGDNSGDGGQLVKFDFSQPHGPGSMDHSIASVRRYPEVKLHRDEDNRHSHAGMVVHPTKRVLFVSNPGKGTIIAVYIDTGKYSRTAREEYPIFSNRLPSFEYSIYECVEREEIFADGLVNPSGLALSLDGERLFVAERGGRILVLEVDTGAVLQTIDLAARRYTSVGGLAVSPVSGALYFVDMDANQAVRINAARSNVWECAYESHANLNFQSSAEAARAEVNSGCGEDTFSLTRDYACRVDGTIPNGTLFEQVHTDTGYASDNPDVQSMAGMDAAAAFLADRTDCEYDSELNLDALLLGGYYCHVCLPRNQGASCDAGGTCTNVQWQGFTCDNEYHVDIELNDNERPLLVVSSLHFNETYPEDTRLLLERGVTYRFTVGTGPGYPVTIGDLSDFIAEKSELAKVTKSLGIGVTDGPLLLEVDDSTPDCLCMTAPGTPPVVLVVDGTKDDCPVEIPEDLELPLPEQTPSGGELPLGEESSNESEEGGEPNDGDYGGTGEWDLLPTDESPANSLLSLGVRHALLLVVMVWMHL